MTMSTMQDQAPMSVRSEIAKLRAENAALKASQASKNKLTLKVSGKGAVSIYGMGRFPTTLYAEGVARMFEGATGGFADVVHAFLEANRAELKTKDETPEAYAARTGKPLGGVSDADETNGQTAAVGIPGAQVVKGAVVIRRVA